MDRMMRPPEDTAPDCSSCDRCRTLAIALFVIGVLLGMGVVWAMPYVVVP